MVDITLIGAPLDCGKARMGCIMGPDALRVAGLAQTLEGLGHRVRDIGNATPDADVVHPWPDHLVQPGLVAAWTKTLIRIGRNIEGMPVFLGGDHAMAAGSLAGMAARAADHGRALFVLWLDAHPDFHTPYTTTSGNLHGTPMAYVTGQTGFDGFPPLPIPVPLLGGFAVVRYL